MSRIAHAIGDPFTGEEAPGACPICFMENAERDGAPCLACQDTLHKMAEQVIADAFAALRAGGAQ